MDHAVTPHFFSTLLSIGIALTTSNSLREMLQPENLAVYAQRATGQKFLVDPSKLG